MEPRWSYSNLFVALLWQLLRPRKQILQEVHIGFINVFRDLRQKMLQVFVDILLVGLGGLYQTVDDRAGFGTVDGVNDMPVGSANGEGADCPFCCRVVDRDIAIFQKYLEVLLLVSAVVQAIPGLLAEDSCRILLVNPCKISLHKRLYLSLAAGISFFCS